MAETNELEIAEFFRWIDSKGPPPNNGFICRAARDARRLIELERALPRFDDVTRKRIENAVRASEGYGD